jgi:RNA polymerase sigma-70 factor (ECF subfamily)
LNPSAAASSPGRSRDEEITAFYVEHRSGLRGYLVNVCRCPGHEADDIVQEAFLAVREQWDHVRHYDKPKAYLYKVAVRRYQRLSAQWAARSWPGDPDDHLLAFPDPADAFAASDLRISAMELLRQLPPRQRQVVGLRGAGFTEAETAQIMSVSLGTVKSQLHDARARIAELERKATADEWRTEPGD